MNQLEKRVNKAARLLLKHREVAFLNYMEGKYTLSKTKDYLWERLKDCGLDNSEMSSKLINALYVELGDFRNKTVATLRNPWYRIVWCILRNGEPPHSIR